jgi:glycosyltransferase involved in cell wall biosynthesis
MSQRRIAIVAHWDWVIWNFRLPLVEALVTRGDEVVLICPRGDYTSRFATTGATWVEWQVGRGRPSPLLELRSVIDLVRIYRRVRPTIVHHFTMKPVVYGSIAARVARVSRVVNSFTGLGYLFGNHEARRLRRLFVPLARAALRRRGAVAIVQLDDDLDTLRRHRIIAPSAPAIVIPGSGVDLDTFHPVDSNRDQVTVVMACRLLADKGVRELVVAARALAAPGRRFLLVGGLDPGNPASISSTELDAWRAEGIVELPGHVDDMPAVLRDADIAVLPSYHEGVPKFLLEAAASGLAIVASDIPGCRVVVQPGVTGLLVPPRSATALEAAIGVLLDDPARRTSYGLAARRLAEERFSIEAVVEQHLRIYDELAS